MKTFVSSKLPSAATSKTTHVAHLAPPQTQRHAGRQILTLVPGLALAAAVAGLAYIFRMLPGMSTFSPMILAIMVGMVFRNIVGTAAIFRPGLGFCVRCLLRLAVVLLGMQLTITQVAQLGSRGAVIIIITLLATFAFTVAIGRLLGVDRKLTRLIAAGTSICGASAVIATNTVTNASDEDVAYAVACVTIFGSVAMFAYPALPALLHLDAQNYGLWAGSSIHEVAQVVAAAFQDSQNAGEIGTIAKLSRVMLLAPMVIALGFMETQRILRTGSDSGVSARPPIPWFVLGFVALIGVNSVLEVPSDIKVRIVITTTLLLTLALAAMGLETDIRKLRAKGLRPALLGALAFLFIGSFSFALIKLIG